MARRWLDLGHAHRLRFVAWAPDRALNPHYADLPDVERYGAIISHPHHVSGKPCEGFVTFDGEVQRRLSADRPRWTVEAVEPLTLSPSVLCSCGDHGFIRDGLWVPA